MDRIKHIDYWLKSAEHDKDVAISLLNSGKYDWCLFLCHLVLEKTMKALFVAKYDSFPPKTHNLLVLAKEADLYLDDITADFFEEVNTFNISTRYPDEKLNFYRLCTPEYTVGTFEKVMERVEWLKKMI